MNRLPQPRGLPVLVALLSLAIPPAAMAIYTPNPAGRWEPQRFFLAGDFQFNSEKDLDANGGRREIGDMIGIYARPSYSIVRNVVIYGRLGTQFADDVDAGLAVGFGVQGAYVFPRAPAWAIGGSFDYLHWSADFENGGPSIDWNEFQLAPAVSYRIPSVPEFTPYAGLMFDFVDARDPLREDDPVGFLVGTNIDPTPNVRLDIQVRAVSELGFFFSAGYLF